MVFGQRLTSDMEMLFLASRSVSHVFNEVSGLRGKRGQSSLSEANRCWFFLLPSVCLCKSNRHMNHCDFMQICRFQFLLWSWSVKYVQVQRACSVCLCFLAASGMGDSTKIPSRLSPPRGSLSCLYTVSTVLRQPPNESLWPVDKHAARRTALSVSDQAGVQSTWICPVGSP